MTRPWTGVLAALRRAGRHPGSGRRPDDGAALLLAVMFIMLVGLVVGSLLGLSGTAISSTGVTGARGQTDYNVDGDLQAAINSIRQGNYDNLAGQDCINVGGNHYLSYAGGQVAVTCAPASGSGGGGVNGVHLGTNNEPSNALLTLGQDAGDGINQTGNNTFWVRGGPVRSNSKISVSGHACPGVNCAQLRDSTDGIYSVGPCTSAFTSPLCQAGAITADPGYAQPSVSGATVRTAPACNSTSAGTVQLQPGLYTDVTALNTLTSSCTSKVILFTPGVYFFDFRNGEPGQVSGTTNQWTVASGVTIVGGTPKGWDRDPSATGKPNFTMPGACVSPLSSENANTGVEFVFGGDSQWVVQAQTHIEVCGQWSATSPPITLMGAKADDGSGSRSNVLATGTVTSPANPVKFVPSSGTLAGGISGVGGQADVASFSGNKTTATLLASAYNPSPAIPAGATITGASLSVRQTITTVTPANLTWTATVTPHSGTVLPLQDLTKDGAGHPYVSGTPYVAKVDLTPGIAAAVAHVPSNFTGLDVQLDATTTKNGTSASVSVDAVWLDISYVTLNGVRAQTTTLAGTPSCTGAVPYLATSTNCAMLLTSGNNADLSIEGTTYAPLAALSVNAPNRSAQVFRQGVIARALFLSLPASFSYTQPIIDLATGPDTPVDLKVYLNAYTCPNPGSCSGTPPGNGWRPAGTAVADISNDAIPINPGARKVTVDSWQLMR